MLGHSKNKGLEWCIDIFFYVLGSAIYAVAINTFTAPNQIAPGGITGLATVGNYLFHIPIGVLTFLLNVPIFIWAVIGLGYHTVLKTVVATVVLSAGIDVLSPFLPAYEGDPILAGLFGGVIQGMGLSLIFMRGATTGGSDTIAQLLLRKHPHLSMGKILLGVDATIVIISAVAFQSLESALYAFLAIFSCSRVVDTILYGTSIGNGKLLFIMSEKSQEIANAILAMDRGVTLLKAKGAYSGKENAVVLSAVRREQVQGVKDVIHELDPNAFFIVGDAGEIGGEGFGEFQPKEKTLGELLFRRKKQP